MFKINKAFVVYALHRCGSTDQLDASKTTWVTSLISLTFSINLLMTKSNASIWSVPVEKFTKEARTIG